MPLAGFMNILVGYVSEEEKIAVGLKAWIETAFASQCDAVLSCDQLNVPAGSKWFEEIDHALDASKVVLIICSPRSIQKPWISFHACWATTKKIPVIAVCISGFEKGPLPFPLSEFQRIDLSQSNAFQRLSEIIAKELGITKPPGFLSNS
jgi:hypothetical protein